MNRDPLRTGQVAAQAGVNVQTLRYYERRGLLKEPERRASGYREYPPDAVQLIRFSKRAQDLAYTLTEIEDLLRIRGDQECACSEVRAAAEAKIDDIEQKIRHLRAIKRALRRARRLVCHRGLAPPLSHPRAGLLVKFEPYRPYFMAMTFALLGAGFYFTHRKPKPAAGAAAAEGPECACPASRATEPERSCSGSRLFSSPRS